MNSKVTEIFIPTYDETMTPEVMIELLMNDWGNPWVGEEINRMGVPGFVQNTIFQEYLDTGYAFRKSQPSPGRNWVRLTSDAFEEALTNLWSEDRQTHLSNYGWDNMVAPYEDSIKRGDAIASIWTIDDVKALDENLTDEDARRILANVQYNFDANDGINWGVIQREIDEYHDGVLV